MLSTNSDHILNALCFYFVKSFIAGEPLLLASESGIGARENNVEIIRTLEMSAPTEKQYKKDDLLRNTVTLLSGLGVIGSSSYLSWLFIKDSINKKENSLSGRRKKSFPKLQKEIQEIISKRGGIDPAIYKP